MCRRAVEIHCSHSFCCLFFLSHTTHSRSPPSTHNMVTSPPPARDYGMRKMYKVFCHMIMISPPIPCDQLLI